LHTLSIIHSLDGPKKDKIFSEISPGGASVDGRIERWGERRVIKIQFEFEMLEARLLKIGKRGVLGMDSKKKHALTPSSQSRTTS
jgi:hypothetical protein